MNQFMQRNRERIKQRNVMSNIDRIATIIRVFYYMQVFVAGVAFIYYILIYIDLIEEHTLVQPIFILGILVIMLGMNGYFIFKDRILYRRIRFEADSREVAFVNIERLNRDLRAQRHDFLNHIQVLYSLMELEEYEETTNYLNHLYGDIVRVGKRIKTKSVSVNALLQAKSNEAEKKGVMLDILLKSQLDRIPIGDWEFCRILGNLVDNAFEALLTAQISKKVVTIQVYETIKSIEVRVRNNGPFVPEHLTKRIFDAGISTKAEKEEHGMGLYICKQLLEEQGHKLVLEQEGDVCFHITLNK